MTAKRVGILVTVVVAIAALGFGGSRVYTRLQPCRGEHVRCIDATHVEVCTDGYLTARCARCSEGVCEPPSDPVPGDACVQCQENRGGGALPEQWRCSRDKRTVMDCAGCFGVWRVSKTCAATETCSESGPMGADCVP